MPVERASLADLEAAADGWWWEAAIGGTLWIKDGCGSIATARSRMIPAA